MFSVPYVYIKATIKLSMMYVMGQVFVSYSGEILETNIAQNVRLSCSKFGLSKCCPIYTQKSFRNRQQTGHWTIYLY